MTQFYMMKDEWIAGSEGGNCLGIVVCMLKEVFFKLGDKGIVSS